MTDIDTLAATLRKKLSGVEQRAQNTAETVARLGLTPDLPLSVVLVQAVVARDRRLLDLLLAEKHGAADSGVRYRPCATLADLADPCDCGRDERVAAYLAVLAEGYEETK